MVAPGRNALDSILNPLAECLTRESAERLVRLRVDAATRERVEELARKASAGELSEGERAEYLDYVEAMDLVGILQSKARSALVRSARG